MEYKATRKQIKKLIKINDFEGALQMTLELRQEYGSHEALHRLINKLKFKIRKQELEKRKSFIKEGLRTIKKIQSEDKFKEAIKACDELLEVDPYNKKGEKLLYKSKIAFIDQKLKDPLQKKWHEEEEYEKLYLFYQKLRKVFPEHPKLNELIKDTEKKVIDQDRKQKKIFEREMLIKLSALHDEGKFEDVIQGCKDLINYMHKGSKSASKLLAIAEIENRKEIEQETYAFMTNQQPILKAAYESGEGSIIKI